MTHTQTKKEENQPSAKLQKGLTKCTCHLCGKPHKMRNADKRNFCPTCRRIANDDYSDGAGSRENENHAGYRRPGY